MSFFGQPTNTHTHTPHKDPTPNTKTQHNNNTLYLREELQQQLHEVGLEDVAGRHPRQVGGERAERRAHERRAARVDEHVALFFV